MSSLCVLGKKYGTDKVAHGYLPTYERVFAPWRDQSCIVFEIGVRAGPSIRMWEEWFPKAHIVGLDIDPSCKALRGDRTHIIIGNQATPAKWLGDRYLSSAPIGVVVDDGSHKGPDVIASFVALWPRLAPGGVYAIEDLAAHYYPERYGPSAYTFLKELVYAPNAQYSGPYSDIESVEFHRELCIVRKRTW